MTRPIALALTAALCLGVPHQALHAQATDSTALLMARGKQLFQGRGLCFSCHGLKGEGMLGPDTKLVGRTLRYSKPELPSLMTLIKNGVDSAQSKSKLMMPPMGGARLNDLEVKSLATYVLDLLKHDSLP